MKGLGLSSEEEWMAEDIFTRIFTTFMEAVHVELSNERVDVAMSEVFGQNVILKVIDLFDGKFSAVNHPVDDVLVFSII